MPAAHLILASASPRRRALLARLGLAFDVVPPDIEEDAPASVGRPERIARRLAVAKARTVAVAEPRAVVLAADTVVAHRGLLLGKPAGAPEAAAMLRRLRAGDHRVITALAVAAPGRRRLVAHAVTRVRMRNYSDGEIAASIARGDPFDKAGAYAIQDEALRPVERYESLPAGRQGCYCNVVGLPLWTAMAILGRASSELLERAGLDITALPLTNLPAQCAECPLRLDTAGKMQAVS